VTKVHWDETPLACTALLDGIPVCVIKTKDIGGCIANWLDDRKWAPPAHLPKASPQDAKFFTDKESAKLAVQNVLLGSL
jgi:hypothetical protein